MTDPSRPYDPDDICDDETYLTGRREKHLGFKRSARANLHTFPGGAPLGRIEALGALAQLGEVVYAVSTPDGQVKIGHTKNLYNRMRTFATGHRSRDFTLLAFTFGTHEDEMAVHHQLADHRHHGREWYNPTPEVLAVVNGWREALGRDPLAA